MAGYAELYDTTLGHIGHSWEREEFDIDFKANKPIGDSHHVAFGLSYRHLTLDVVESVLLRGINPSYESQADPLSGLPSHLHRHLLHPILMIKQRDKL